MNEEVIQCPKCESADVVSNTVRARCNNCRHNWLIGIDEAWAEFEQWKVRQNEEADRALQQWKERV